MGSEAPEEDLEPQSWGRGRAGPAGRVEAGRCFRPELLGAKGQEPRLGVCCHGSCRPRAPPPRHWLAFPRRLCPPQAFPFVGWRGVKVPFSSPLKLQKSNLGWGRGGSPT